MKAELISTGTELLLGQIVNTNAQYLSQKLSSLGIDVYFQITVGDNPDRLAAAVEQALERSDMVITTGGLGPTMDDLTKEMVARVMGLEMQLDEESYRRIKAFFEDRGRKMPENNKKQAYFPHNAHILPNNVGTAPGAIVDKDGKMAVILPGPPMEMQPMFDDYVWPFLSRKTSAQPTTIKSRVLRVFGLGESAVEERIADLFANQTNPTLAFQAKPAEVHIRITAKASSEAEAMPLINEMEAKLRERLGHTVFGADEETMEAVVGRMLLEKGLTIAVAESCTGGALSSRLTDISGSSSYYLYGVVSYSNEAKTHFLGVPAEIISQYGAVSEPCARAMAEGVRKIRKTDFGLSVTGIAGPTGGTPAKPVGTVYMALATSTGTFARRFSFAGNRATVKLVTGSAALNMVRRYLLGEIQESDS